MKVSGLLADLLATYSSFISSHIATDCTFQWIHANVCVCDGTRCLELHFHSVFARKIHIHIRILSRLVYLFIHLYCVCVCMCRCIDDISLDRNPTSQPTTWIKWMYIVHGTVRECSITYNACYFLLPSPQYLIHISYRCHTYQWTRTISFSSDDAKIYSYRIFYKPVNQLIFSESDPNEISLIHFLFVNKILKAFFIDVNIWAVLEAMNPKWKYFN